MRDHFGDSDLERVWRVLNRDSAIAPLSELRTGLFSDGRPSFDPQEPFALGFDTNAIFRVGLGARGADSLDYLRAKHDGPVIIPGQAIQEIWNNLLAAVEPQAKKLRKMFDDLSVEVLGIDQSLGAPGVAVREAIEDLVSSHGDWIDPSAQAAFDATLDVLETVGTCRFVPRSEFATLAEIRKATKTPPGFRDAIGYGDFFIWADFLYGVAGSDPKDFGAVVFVTNDAKSDWSRHGVAHPVLVAEALGIVNVPFRLLALSEFQKFAKGFSS